MKLHHETKTPNFSKSQDGLLPAIVQDAQTRQVLMLGYMNAESFEKTKAEGRVTFFSRSRQTLWTKGETSGNYLFVKKILVDCDQDALLILASPVGAVCHTGAATCFEEKNDLNLLFLNELQEIIRDRRTNHASAGSYTARLFEKGIHKIAQKVGEEAVEVVIEAMSNNDHLLKNEAADLLFHLLVLLEVRNLSLNDVVAVLVERNGKMARH